MKPTILCVEDEASIRQMVRLSLEREGYQVIEAGAAFQARELIADKPPALALVDWMLPDMPGTELILQLRQDELTQNLPIIMLTARSQEEDMITGLDVGADDYLVKPISLKTLNARIKALLRRAKNFQARQIIVAGCLQLDCDAHQLTVSGEPVRLGITEYRLLEFLMQHPDKVYSRAQLLDFVWGQGTYIEERTVDVHILRLRKALAPSAVSHVIRTVRGAGYLFSGVAALE